MALKAWAYWLTNSIGLLSDALESSVNLLAALIAVYALTVAAKPPDEKHHFGHGKAEYFSSAIEGLLVLIAAALIILSSLDHLQAPHPLQQLDWGLAVAAAASLINLLTARALKSAGRRFRSIALEADAAHLMSDVWTSVGVAAGLGLAWLTGEYILDPIIALLVATHIVWSGLTLIYRSVHGLLDAALPAEDNAGILRVLEKYRLSDGVDFHDLRTRQSGAHRFVSLHLLVPGDLSVKAAHDLADRIEADIQAALPGAAVSTHIEPLDDPASYHPSGPMPTEPTQRPR
ncbi:transporter [Methylogaea oryzae]|uniref:Transporter n=2 Tax=Methylogaea oryzae TaxID=1295382 RepID=A0A8D5ANJ9_9GAMM|nr:transporter [Methylogaea oryzae]